MDGHRRSIRRLPGSLHSFTPLPLSACFHRHRRPALHRQGCRHMHLLGSHHCRRQPDVLLRPPVPACVNLLARLRYSAGFQRGLRLLHKLPEVHLPDPQLRRAPDLLRGPLGIPIRFRGLRQRPQGEVPAGVRADAWRVRDVLAHPLPVATRLPKGPQDGDLLGGAVDTDMHVVRGDHRLRGRAVRQRGVVGAAWGDGGVREGEGVLPDDAGLDGGGVAGVLRWGGGLGVCGVLSLLQRGEHPGSAAGAHICCGVLP